MASFIAFASSSASNDKFVAALWAAGIFMLLCLVAVILLMLQLLRTLTSRSSADAGGFRTLAVSWWVVCFIGLWDGIFLVSHEPNTLNLSVMAAALVFTAGMGGLAARTGKRLAQRTGPDTQASPSTARLPIIVVLVVLLIAGVCWWLTYQSRLRAVTAQDDAAQAGAKAQSRGL
jgi:hypothetical protein